MPSHLIKTLAFLSTEWLPLLVGNRGNSGHSFIYCTFGGGGVVIIGVQSEEQCVFNWTMEVKVGLKKKRFLAKKLGGAREEAFVVGLAFELSPQPPLVSEGRGDERIRDDVVFLRAHTQTRHVHERRKQEVTVCSRAIVNTNRFRFVLLTTRQKYYYY